MGDDWDEYLPALELAFNSKQQASTGAAPFTLVYGTEARLPIDCALDDARPASVPAAGQRAERMRRALDHARSQAEQAQAKQKRLADRHRRLLLLKEGDQVLLATEGLQLRSGTHKLTGRYIGPFRVMGSVNDNAVTLDLPPLLGALHPTFNISRLKPYRDGRGSFPGRPQRLHAAACRGARIPTASPSMRWNACWRNAAAAPGASCWCAGRATAPSTTSGSGAASWCAPRPSEWLSTMRCSKDTRSARHTRRCTSSFCTPPAAPSWWLARPPAYRTSRARTGWQPLEDQSQAERGGCDRR